MIEIKCSQIFSGLALLFLTISCSTKSHKTSSTMEISNVPQSWDQAANDCLNPNCENDPSTREPASLKETFSPLQTQALKSLVSPGRKDFAVRTKLDVRVWSDIDAEFLSGKTKKALDEALRKTFEQTALGAEFMSGLKKNLIQRFLKNFVFTIQAHQLVDGDIRFDFYFVPEVTSANNNSNELASNQLMHFQFNGTPLSQKWTREQNRSITQETYTGALQMYDQTREEPQYNGGVLSVHLKILSTTLEAKIPNPLKRAIQGHVRYRRYVFQPASFRDNFESKCLDVSNPSQKIPDKLFYSTVDLLQSYDLQSMIPSDEKIVIYPGVFLSAAEGLNKTLPPRFEFVGKSISVPHWLGTQIEYDVRPKTGATARYGAGAIDSNPQIQLSKAFKKECHQNLVQTFNLNNLFR